MKNPQKLFPMIITDKLAETKEFYLKHAGFEIRIDTDEYFQVRAGSGEDDPEIAFMAPGTSPDGTVFPEFGGKGIVLSVPTKSADEKAEALRKAGVKNVADPADKPWGWRSFLVQDPSGVLLDFFQVVAENPMLVEA